MTDWTNEEEEAFNDVEKHSNLGKQILRDIEGQPYHFAKREWVKLTNEQYLEACKIAEGGNYMVAFQRIQQWLKENNT